MQPDQSPRPADETTVQAALRLCEEARRLARGLRCDEAASAASRAVELDPDCAAAYELRVALRLPGQDWPALIADLTEIIRLRPGRADAFTQRAGGHNHVGQYERAVLDCNRAVELDPLCGDAYFHRSYALLRLGREAESDADHRRWFLLHASPEQLEARDRRDLIVALLDRGGSALEAGRSEWAVQAYSAVLLEEPDHTEARLLRGRAYARLGRFEEASSDLLEAWRLKEERDRIGRGYLVAVGGSKGEKLWAAFPDSPVGRCDAIALAEDLVKDPAPVEKVRRWIGDFVQTKVYRLEGSEIEVVDYVWSEGQKARPKQAVVINCVDTDETRA